MYLKNLYAHEKLKNVFFLILGEEYYIVFNSIIQSLTWYADSNIKMFVNILDYDLNLNGPIETVTWKLKGKYELAELYKNRKGRNDSENSTPWIIKSKKLMSKIKSMLINKFSQRNYKNVPRYNKLGLDVTCVMQVHL